MKPLLHSLLLSCFVWGGLPLIAQTPGGNMYFTDIDAFNQPGPGQGVPRYLRCGNDPSVNIPFAITMEAWVKLTIPTDNQKLMGKVDANAGAVFNDGYLLGVVNSRLSPEIWTPNNNTFSEGFIPPISAWHHIAVTYQMGGQYRAYLDGEMVYETNAGNQPIVNDDTQLIIGIAPWDLASFMTFGSMDEIRIWDVALNGAQIREQMFRKLDGTENGLVFYINFDLDDDQSDTIQDLSLEGNDCDRVNLDETNLIASTAVLGNATTQAQQDLYGLWFGNSTNFLDPRLTVTDNGLSMSAFYNGQDSSAFVVWGHNGASGVTQDNLPPDAPANTRRTKRVWHATTFGNIKPTLIVDLQAAAAGGTTLSSEKPANHYTLLERQGSTGNFSAVAYAEGKNGNELTFNWVPLQSAFYTVAVGDAPFDVTNAAEIDRPGISFELFPNPNAGTFVLSGPQFAGEGLLLEVFNAAGQRVFQQREMDFSGQTNLQLKQQAGLYLLKWTAAGQTGFRRFLIQ